MRIVLHMPKNVVKFSSMRKTRKERKTQSAKEVNRPKHGIKCPSQVSKQLADFFGTGPRKKIARTTVVSKLNE